MSCVKLLKMKRTHPPLSLPGSPLIYVVAQVNISAVVAIERYVPEIQERLRKSGFPGYTNVQVPEIIFETFGARPVVTPLSRYEFQNKLERTGIVLTPKSIAVHTNQYTTFDDFHAIIAMALETIHATAALQLHERIGLRYVDLIEFERDEELKDYLAPDLLGYDQAAVGMSGGQFNFQFEGNTPYGRLVARHYAPQVRNMLPPDLAGVSLNYDYRPAPSPGRAALLDFDHAADYKGDFVIEEILETLENLHDGLDIIFRDSVTAAALEKWGRKDVANAKS
ncbi:MAG TPA: TIGR04255 family protein [Terracidiphilus sp.]|jgi:uncharacterized protein (TIGR04255 family)